jgi:hypothetical protein
MYACMRRDYFIFWSNATGLGCGFFYCISVLPLLSRKVQIRVKITLFFTVTFFIIIIIIFTIVIIIIIIVIIF